MIFSLMLTRNVLVDCFIEEVSNGRIDFRYEHLLEMARHRGVNQAMLQLLLPDGMEDIVADLLTRYESAIRDIVEGSDEYVSLSFAKKITFLLHSTLDFLSEKRRFWLRFISFIVKPQRLRLFSKTLIRIAGFMLRTAGDKSYGFDYYTKRAILISIYMATVTHWCRCDNLQKSKDFAAARVANTRLIGKVKSFFYGMFGLR
jgi:rpsU-divergently transcribed protein